MRRGMIRRARKVVYSLPERKDVRRFGRSTIECVCQIWIDSKNPSPALEKIAKSAHRSALSRKGRGEIGHRTNRRAWARYGSPLSPRGRGKQDDAWKFASLRVRGGRKRRIRGVKVRRRRPNKSQSPP